MKTLKIGIVEDDLIIAASISEMLAECGYAATKPAKRYSEAISMIESEEPDLLLIDINILGRMDGIELARTVQKAFHIPYIFLTANTDFETIARVKEVSPAAFLAKPVTKAQLFAAIEIAVAAFRPSTLPVITAQEQNRPQYLMLNDGNGLLKIAQQDILYAESDDNYLRIHLTDGRTALTRMTLTALLDKLDASCFARTHRLLRGSR